MWSFLNTSGTIRWLMTSNGKQCGSVEKVRIKSSCRRQLWDANTTSSQCSSASSTSDVWKQPNTNLFLWSPFQHDPDKSLPNHQIHWTNHTFGHRCPLVNFFIIIKLWWQTKPMNQSYELRLKVLDLTTVETRMLRAILFFKYCIILTALIRISFYICSR